MSRRTNTNPMRKVVSAHERVHSSIFGPFKTYYWLLRLECGHEVERNIKYLPPADGKKPRKGWGALHHPPTHDRIPDPPKRARCEWCAKEEKA